MNKIWFFVIVGVMIMTTIGQARNNGYSDVSIEYILSGWVEESETRTWTYASSANDPEFTATVNEDITSLSLVGMKLRLKQAAGSYVYFFITKMTYSAPNTTVTMYGGTDYNLANETITSVAFSNAKVPVGFPANPEKWTVEYNSTSTFQQNTPTASTWYDTGFSLDVPIGLWDISYDTVAWTSGGTQIKTTLSTTTNSEVNIQLSDGFSVSGATTVVKDVSAFYLYDITSETTFHLLILTSYVGATYIRTYELVVIRAVCAYL